MPLAGWIALVVALVVIAGITYIRVRDARWYRKHPGANDYLARLDNELTEAGQ
jgi:hypothetical protein